MRLSIAGFLRVDRSLRLTDMDESTSGPRRQLITPNSFIALVLMALKPSHEPLDDWFFTNESSVLAEELEGLDMPVDDEVEADFEEFDEGNDLEPELAASFPSLGITTLWPMEAMKSAETSCRNHSQKFLI